MKNTIEKINQCIWEIRKKIEQDPRNQDMRRDLLRFFHESRVFLEMRAGVPVEDRSFLMLQERESIGCLLIHGAGGTPAEMKLLGEHLFSQGYSVYGIRLPLDPKSSDTGLADYLKGRLSRSGKNGKRDKKKEAANSWSVCLTETEIVLDTMLDYSSGIYMIGFSFGGTIALNLMKRYPVKGTILIAPALYPTRSNRYFFFRFWKRMLPSLVKNYAPVRSTILELLDRTRASLGTLDKPLMVIQAQDDHLISPRGFQLLKKQSTNRASRFEYLSDGGHVLIDGKRAIEVFDLCSSFIREV